MASDGRMEIVVVGPGALGTLLAAVLSRKVSGNIRVLDHDSKRAARLRHHGLFLEYSEGILQAPVFASADPAALRPADLVLLCVKSTAVEGILPALPPLLNDNSLLLAFQNGIAHLPLLEKAALPGYWALAVTSMGATLLEAGRVRFGGSGQTVLGFTRKADESAQAKLTSAAALLNSAGLETRIEAEIMAQVWDKLLVNAGINALTSIYQCRNGALLDREEARKLLIAAVEEAAAVARRKGVHIAAGPVQRTIEVCRATAENISSMLQDVLKKRRTEIDAINGAIVAEADRLGIAVPVNRQLVAAVKALENSYLHDSP